MLRNAPPQSRFRRHATTLTTSLCLLALALPLALPQDAAAAASTLPVSDQYRPTADIGFHDTTRTGAAREVRNDLAGDLGAMVEFAQETTVNPTNNTNEDRPSVVANRVALLMVTPTSGVKSLTVEVSVPGAVQGRITLAAPHGLPASDQTYDARGSVAYSLRAWSAQLPAEWVQPGITLKITDDSGRSGDLGTVDIAPPTELVINNIRLGMLTDAPVKNDQPFITDPAASATDYFQTIPVSKLTMAQYETVELEKVTVSSGEIYTPENPDPSIGSVYAGKMREDVGKAQFSTGVNLATWGVTSAKMTQQQPGHTNQRVIHHSAGLYMQNGKEGAVGSFRAEHGLSGGNGMATLYSSVGNELSHELGHSYGIGHYPGVDQSLSGDDMVRNTSHHMDSGWGYIPYRNLMRSNLALSPHKSVTSINEMAFSENLAESYNFNTDAMSGGWVASDASQYTLHTAYTLKRIQENFKTLVADTEYPSGYRDWDAASGTWVDARALNPEFELPVPAAVGVPVFTLLGGYNPADHNQTVLYPAFRSNYGVTFNNAEANYQHPDAERECWLEVEFENGAAQHIAVDATDGMKQVNVNIAEAEHPTSAQMKCRTHGTTTDMGNAISIATDLEPMAPVVVVGQDAGFETLRSQELASLSSTLEALSDEVAPVLSASDMMILTGWSDDLSPLAPAALPVAKRILKLTADAESVEAYLAEHGDLGTTAANLPKLKQFLIENGYVDGDGDVVPTGSPVTVDNGRCLYLDDTNTLRVDATLNEDKQPSCAGAHTDTWFEDLAGRLHSAEQPELCITPDSSASTAAPCSISNVNQRWVVHPDNHTVVRASSLNSALDYNRQTGFVTLYGLSKTANQYWKTFTTNTNPLLAYLSSNGLAAVAGNVKGDGKPEESDEPPTAKPEIPEPEIPEPETPTTETPTTDFEDVVKGHKFYKDISWMKASGLSTGVRIDGKAYYRPKSSVTREAMAAFLFRLNTPEGKKAPADYTVPQKSPFTDVSPTHKFYKEIAWMYESGISTGINYASGRAYAPKGIVSREAMAAFLYRLEH